MKSLLIAIQAVIWIFASQPAQPEPYNYAEDSDCFASETTAGYIVMEDDIMMLTGSNNTSETITEIEVYNSVWQLVYSSSGCGSSECTSNLGSLAKATYSVYVITDVGGIFSGSVTTN